MPKLHWLCVARKLKVFLRTVCLSFSLPQRFPSLLLCVCGGGGCLKGGGVCVWEWDAELLFLSWRIHVNFIDLYQVSFL